jgi:hypothetical protein
MLMITAGYEDGNDAGALRRDPMFKLALDRLPSGQELCSQSVPGLDPGISRLENLPDTRALLRLGRACGQAENHIKAPRNYLAADRTSCHAAEANQFRLFLHAAAYWLLWSMRHLMPKSSALRVIQFDTLRLRLVKLAARVVELKTQIKIHLPSSAPEQAVFAMPLTTVCPASSPDRRGVCPRNHPFRANFQRLPDPNPRTPPRRGRTGSAFSAVCNQSECDAMHASILSQKFVA